MVVEIKPNVFENLSFYNDLRHLIGLCTYEYRYNFHIDFNLIEHTDSFSKLNKDQQDIIKEFFDRSVHENWKYTHTICENDSQHYSLKEAIKLLERPFFLFLEHSQNDGYFIDCLRKQFKKKCKKLNHLINILWIEYSMGAGSNIYKAIETKLELFKTLPKPNHKYLRCFVLVDSDKSYPTQAYKSELKKLIEFLKENEIPHHVLEKREMENYLPDAVYDEINDNKDFIDAFRRLNPQQKDFFDLEKGFPDKNFEGLPEEIKSLYSNLSIEDKVTFRKNGLKLNGNFKSEFPKLFESDLITRGNLLDKSRTKSIKTGQLFRRN